jgi:hypothetical protein
MRLVSPEVIQPALIRFVAHVDAKFVKHVYDIPQRLQKSDVYFDRKFDDL